MLLKSRFYKHYKTKGIYEVIGDALNAETETVMILYRPLNDSSYKYFVRSVDNFMEVFEDGTRRFEPCDLG